MAKATHDVFGIHPVRILLRRSPENVIRIWVLATGRGAQASENKPRPSPQREKFRSENGADARQEKRHGDLVALAKTHGIAVEEVERSFFDKRSNGENHQGVLAEVRSQESSGPEDFEAFMERLTRDQASGRAALVLVLDEVQDPHNLGACMRSAAAAGADAVIVPKRRAAGMSPVVRKVSSGASEILPLICVTSIARTLETLSGAGVLVLGASANAVAAHYECDLRGPVALVLGGEGAGLRRLTLTVCDDELRIPMPGPMESLNVSVAAGVMLFEAVRQRQVNELGRTASGLSASAIEAANLTERY
jgi:23S rRNA (guanosine2251-2'-O)-methyltransferase